MGERLATWRQSGWADVLYPILPWWGQCVVLTIEPFCWRLAAMHSDL
jgi:hypothetical protein